MKPFAIILALVLLVGGISLHVSGLGALLWYSWSLSGKALPEQALNLARYQVDIEALEVVGIDDDLSALTYNAERNTLWSVLNGEPLIVELSLEGQLLRQVRVEGVSDMEGLTHVGGNRYVLAEERSQRLLIVEIPDDAEQISVEQASSLSIGLDGDGNKGFEGLSWDHVGQRLLVVKERDPLRVLAVAGFVDAPPEGSMEVQISELKAPNSPRLFMSDLSSVTLHEPSGHLLLLSDESRVLVEYDVEGEPLSLLLLRRGRHGLSATVPQAEGVAIDAERRIYLVSEPNLFYRFVPR